MRILMLPKYDQTGASSRLRTYQYVEPLRLFGIEADVAPLLGDNYVSDLYARNISPTRVMGSYADRVRVMLGTSGYDAIWIEKELLPWIPMWLERVVLPKRTSIVVDYDDALFHRYDRHRSGIVRTIYGKKIDAVMRTADIVVAGNDYLASHAKSAGARRVEWLPTVIDLERYPEPEGRGVAHVPVIGWIGSPTTARYLHQVCPALEALKAKYSFRCVAIGARPDQVAGTLFESVEWREDSEVQLLSEIDIGIMPLVDESWERGKCGYKLIQYMAAGRPVVASPVGVNKNIVEPAVNGYLAGTTEEWVSALETLICDPGLRGQMGSNGRARVENTYSVQVQAPRLATVLKSL